MTDCDFSLLVSTEYHYVEGFPNTTNELQNYVSIDKKRRTEWCGVLNMLYSRKPYSDKLNLRIQQAIKVIKM